MFLKRVGMKMLFFAARDAGMFLEGKLELEDFLPEVKSQIRKESEQTKVKS